MIRRQNAIDTLFFSRNLQMDSSNKGIFITPRTKILTLLWSGKEIPQSMWHELCREKITVRGTENVEEIDHGGE